MIHSPHKNLHYLKLIRKLLDKQRLLMWLQEIIALEQAENAYPEEKAARDQMPFNQPYLNYEKLEARLRALKIPKEQQANLFAQRQALLEKMQKAHWEEYQKRVAINGEIGTLLSSSTKSSH